MTRRARDVAIPTQDLVEEERTPEIDKRGILRFDRDDRNDAPPGDDLANLLVERRGRRRNENVAAIRAARPERCRCENQ